MAQRSASSVNQLTPIFLLIVMLGLPTQANSENTINLSLLKRAICLLT